MQIVTRKLTTSGPQEYMILDVDPSVAATGTVFVCYKDASGYTIMTFTTDSTSDPTKTL